MANVAGRPSVILLMDRRAKRESVRAWLQNSRFCTMEAEDVLQALDELSDFTLAGKPDVVFVPVDTSVDLGAICDMVKLQSGDERLTVLSAFKDSSGDTDISKLNADLNRLIPPQTPVLN